MSRARPSIVFVYGDDLVTGQFAPTRYRDRLDVEWFSDPVDALVRMQDGGPCALVMCDLRFPSMMGLDFLLRAREAHPGTKTLVFGAPRDFPALLRARMLGIDAFVLKSLVPPERRVYPTADLLLAHWAAEHDDPGLMAEFPIPPFDPRLEVREVSPDELDASLAVVAEVYGDELGRLGSEDSISDDYDQDAVHFIATYDGRPIGSSRGIVYRPGSGLRLPMETKFDLSAYKSERLAEAGRFVIVADHRGGVASKAMLYAMLMWASRHQVSHVVIASRPELAESYEGLGFRAYQAPARNHKRAYAAVPMHMCIDALDIRFQKLLATPHPNVRLGTDTD